MPGVRIGHGAIIAAGAVVVGDVPDHGIVGGTPPGSSAEYDRSVRGAHEEAHPAIGLITVSGFLLSCALSHV